VIATLALMLVLSQDPKPPVRTVEDRLKELTDKIEALEKQASALADENAKLRQKVDERKEHRDAVARLTGTGWVNRHHASVQFTEKQSTELAELWVGWTKQDFEKPSDVAEWKTREGVLRGKLTEDQASRLVRKVREDQDQNAKAMVTNLANLSKLPAERIPALEKVVLPRLTPEENMLLPQAHPETSLSWSRIVSLVEANLAELTVLTENELESLRKMLQVLKPMNR